MCHRDTDQKPDSWEQSWANPNVEVIMDRDDGAPAQYVSWADYATEPVSKLDLESGECEPPLALRIPKGRASPS